MLLHVNSNKNKVAGSELVGMDHVSIFLFELTDRCEVGFDDSVLDGVKILWSLLELSGSEHYKLSGRHSRLWWMSGDTSSSTDVSEYPREHLE
jgi:hypothetical protein